LKLTILSSEKTSNGGEKKMKLTPLQGVLFATLILSVMGGALQLLSTELHTLDLAWMGAYQTPFLSFFSNSWIFIVVVFIYNVFMYFRQNQLQAMQNATELYDWRKLATTIAWFVGTLGPMAALVSDPQTKGIIALIITAGTAFVQEISNVFGKLSFTLPEVTSTTPSPPATTQPSTIPTDNITWSKWEVDDTGMPPPPPGMHYYKAQKIVNGKPTGFWQYTDRPHEVPPS
jgi:hypothetical protein